MRSFYLCAFILGGVLSVLTGLGSTAIQIDVSTSEAKKTEHESAKGLRGDLISGSELQENRQLSVKGSVDRAVSVLRTGLVIAADHVGEVLRSSKPKQLALEATRSELFHPTPLIHTAVRRRRFFSNDAIEKAFIVHAVNSFSLGYMRLALRVLAQTLEPEAYTAIYTDLLLHYFENDLAILILRAKGTSPPNTHIDMVEAAQFGAWFERNLKPIHVEHGLDNLPGMVPVREHEAERIADSYKQYIRRVHAESLS
ncbi:unnamed protein product [Hyaloperonospora brassicae]|uniref:RxLR effector candidate protein n=1 Tax=Hyaloperonospora brassicae TaxID=162125 RepID=A0AAV0TL51_HYABA|nr:unnamed protein product [Hyaloperonospora brassicae]